MEINGIKWGGLLIIDQKNRFGLLLGVFDEKKNKKLKKISKNFDLPLDFFRVIYYNNTITVVKSGAILHESGE